MLECHPIQIPLQGDHCTTVRDVFSSIDYIFDVIALSSDPYLPLSMFNVHYRLSQPINYYTEPLHQHYYGVLLSVTVAVQLVWLEIYYPH